MVTPNVNTARAMEGSGDSDTLMVNITVALPTYNPDVHSWFQQVETIFLMLRIKSQRIKVANLMQKLPPDVISRITDALAELPEKTPYDYLKDIILKRTGRSEEERIRDVLQNITIGDRTPAQLLRFMKSQLGSKHVSETVLRTLWMERLPSWVSQIIAPMSRSTALDDLADSADLVFERSNNITSVQAPTSESQTTKELRAMKKMMADLQKQLREMKVTRRQRPRDRTHSRHRRPRTPSYQRRRHLLVSSDIWRPSKEMQAALQIHGGPGKLGNRRVTTTNPSGIELKTCRLFYIWDRRNKIKFLVDTGAAISVIPHTIDPSAKPTPLKTTSSQRFHYRHVRWKDALSKHWHAA